MKIQENSKLLKWAYFGCDEKPWSQVSLCVLFWRVVLVTPLKIVAMSAVVALFVWAICVALSTVIYAVATHLAITGLVLSGAAILVLLILGTRKVAGGGTLIGEFVAAKKRKICPLIEIVYDRN